MRNRLVRMLWGCVYVICFRQSPIWMLRKWRVFLLRLFGAKIGKTCRIDPTCKIWAPWNLKMGSHSCLADSVDCYSVSPIIIGNHVTVSQRSYLCSASHNIHQLDLPLIHQPIQIQDHAWICAQAFIGPGVTIGEGAIVGACAVVTKDVEAWTVVAGNPARFIKKREILSVPSTV